MPNPNPITIGTAEANIDAALSTILRAGGTSLHALCATQAKLDKVREAMRKVMSASYIQGANDNFNAMKGKRW